METHTAVQQDFIDEYYVFYEKCEDNEYGILLDDVVNYLKIRNVKRFYENFRKKYEENVNYIKTETGEKKEENVKYTLYHINLDTFEKICMNSNAKKANDVRDYFIILIKFIQYYHKHISEMIKNNAI